jgi:DNA recombination protein RmuC
MTMMEIVGVLAAMAVVTIVALIVAALAIVRGRRGAGLDANEADAGLALDERFDTIGDALHGSSELLKRELERVERTLRGDAAETARIARSESHGVLTQFQQAVAAQLSSVATLQNQKVDGFARDLAQLTQSNATQLEAVRLTLAEQARIGREEQTAGLRHVSETLERRLHDLAQGNDLRMAEMRTTLERKLQDLEAGNAAKLEEMRQTVDEKLHATLEHRLGESFKLVSDRLEQVHRGLGEMQTLAAGVGDLKKVLTNVKTRGTWGEVQLGGLLEQILTQEQFARNVATVPGSSERVEFAIRLPGRAALDAAERHAPVAGSRAGAGDESVVWLPIDAKFPREDYERLVDAQDRADPVGVEEAGKALEGRVRAEARRIAEKYVSPPHTTDFALLFLPTEGLYAEVLRRPGLSDALQREYRITIAGPTTLTALLNSLQMGFRTLAIEQRSSEVWQVLGAVKTEFTKFGNVLAKTRAQLETVTRSIDLAEQRTRVMHQKLRHVEALPGDAAALALGALPEEVSGDAAPADASASVVGIAASTADPAATN